MILVRDVHDLEPRAFRRRVAERRQREIPRIIIEDAPVRPRWIFPFRESNEERGAENRPQNVENEISLRRAACHLRLIICAP